MQDIGGLSFLFFCSGIITLVIFAFMFYYLSNISKKANLLTTYMQVKLTNDTTIINLLKEIKNELISKASDKDEYITMTCKKCGETFYPEDETQILCDKCRE